VRGPKWREFGLGGMKEKKEARDVKDGEAADKRKFRRKLDVAPKGGGPAGT